MSELHKKFKCSVFLTKNFPGIFRIIFSFIPQNKTVYHFALSCQNIYKVFHNLLQHHNRIYKLNYLNVKKQRDRSFNLYSVHRNLKFSIDKDRYSANIKEFESGFVDNFWIDAIAEINKKYGQKAMIAGGYALLNFTKSKNWSLHRKKFLTEDPIRTHALNEIENSDIDIDVFILGDNKIKIAQELLNNFKKYHDINNKIYAKVAFPGLINVYQTSGVKFINPRSELKCQIILKKAAQTPNDIFCLFDLDCCKIGYFPGLKTVIANIDFVRAISLQVNYFPIIDTAITSVYMSRIRKYFHRTGIKTSIQQLPLLSCVHTHYPNNPQEEFVSLSGISEYLFDEKTSLHKKVDWRDYYTWDGEINIDESIICITEWKTLKYDTQLETEYYYRIFGIIKNNEGCYVVNDDKLRESFDYLKNLDLEFKKLMNENNTVKGRQRRWNNFRKKQEFHFKKGGRFLKIDQERVKYVV